MGTLRGFVDAVLPDPESMKSRTKKPKFWSKPDRMSETLELRKLTAPQTRSRPPTDFFEFYWAYQAQGTKYAHVVVWLRTVLVRKPSSVPKHLRLLWWSVWAIIALVMILGVAGYFAKWKLIVQASRVLSAVFALLLLVVSGFIKGYLGDAARYLDARPSNIALRRRIRSDGISLLRRLHDCGEYDRIVMVGHSLGTIIAYDILKHYWVEVNTTHAPLLNLQQEALKALQLSGVSLSGDVSPAAVDGFQEKQIQLWLEQRRLGNSWLVTDLVSLGSPLAHGALLLARNEAELRQRQAERELPTCPPAEDEYSYYYPLNYSVGDDKRTIRVLHHAAHFACTRWTNLYFPAKWGFFGDLVGGPLRDVFGHGIKDVPLTSAVGLGLLQHTPLIHTHYWEGEARACTDERAHTPAALENLLRALDLDSRPWLAQVGPVKTTRDVAPE